MTREHKIHRDRQDWWVPIFRGGWLVIVGAFALYSPPTSPFTLQLLFATAAFITGGALLTDGLTLRSKLSIAQGVLSMAVAAPAAFLPPDLWIVTVDTIAAWAIAMGAIDLLLVRRHSRIRGGPFLVTAAALSILGGIAGLIVPIVLDNVPIAAFGVVGILAGSSLIGFGLRRRRSKGRMSAVNAAHRQEERRVDEAAHVT